MGKLSRLEPIVKEILVDDPRTRDDDMYLYYMYVCKVIGCWKFEEVFFDKDLRKEYKVSPYHSVARCRRKLQATCEELKPSKAVQDARLNETSDYINYAIDGYNTSFMKMIDSYE